MLILIELISGLLPTIKKFLKILHICHTRTLRMSNRRAAMNEPEETPKYLLYLYRWVAGYQGQNHPYYGIPNYFAEIGGKTLKKTNLKYGFRRQLYRYDGSPGRQINVFYLVQV